MYVLASSRHTSLKQPKKLGIYVLGSEGPCAHTYSTFVQSAANRIRQP